MIKDRHRYGVGGHIISILVPIDGVDVVLGSSFGVNTILMHYRNDLSTTFFISVPPFDNYRTLEVKVENTPFETTQANHLPFLFIQINVLQLLRQQ